MVYGWVMVISAKDAEGGRRYRCVDTGDIVEVCIRPQDARNGKRVPLTSEDGTFIHVEAISTRNKRIQEKDSSSLLVIPAFYKLEPYDGPYTKAPIKRVSAPKPPRPSSYKTGRPKKGEIPWRGWGAHARHDMERILEVVESEGFWFAETFHYFRVGYQAETCLGVFKAGQLGFHTRPSGALGEFPTKPPTTDPYMPWRVELSTVMAADKWDAMLNMLRRYMREFRGRIERRKRR
jgi:hypothetical protein